MRVIDAYVQFEERSRAAYKKENDIGTAFNIHCAM